MRSIKASKKFFTFQRQGKLEITIWFEQVIIIAPGVSLAQTEAFHIRCVKGIKLYIQWSIFWTCIYPFVSSCYAKHSSLFENAGAINNENGVQQGDLLGPLLFSLALMSFINKIKQEVPMLLQNSWYLDDGILAETETELMHSLDFLESEGKDLSFNLKTSKGIFWSPKTMSNLDQNIKRADHEGFEVLGAPIGTETNHVKVSSKSVEKIQPLLGRLQHLGLQDVDRRNH